MRKVTTVNLNDNAFQIDEDGYEALRSYLEAAERALAGNPDRAEILQDLEQAIADKCRLALGSYKSVVNAAEMQRILTEMGPVAGGDAAPAAGEAAGATPGTGGAGTAGVPPPRPRRLYRVREGQKLSGVCNGLAAYAGVDATWVRVVFILLTLFSFGFGVLGYLALLVLMPVAETPEEIAAAHGQTFSAQELVDRIKKKSDDHRSEHRARRHARRGMNHGPAWWSTPVPPRAPGYTARITGGLFAPVLTVLSAVWFAGMAVVLMAAWWSYDHMGFTYRLHEPWDVALSMPRWLLVALLVGVYALLALPIGAGRRAALFYANGGQAHGWASAWSGVLWLVIVALLMVAAWQLLPPLQQLIPLEMHHGRQVLQI